MADRYGVFVRFANEKTAQRLQPNGSTTRRKVHAAMFQTMERAEEVARECQEYLDQHVPGSRAWAAPF
jgi:hypothetical protein